MKALDKDQALLISAYTGYVVVNGFSEIHEYIEKVMGEAGLHIGDGRQKFQR